MSTLSLATGERDDDASRSLSQVGVQESFGLCIFRHSDNFQCIDTHRMVILKSREDVKSPYEFSAIIN